MINEQKMMEKIKHNAANVDAFILEHLQGKVKILWDASAHYIKAGGKRLRPFLVNKSNELCHGNTREITPISSAVEILHNFTLIHDDIMDNDDFRRNVPTVHYKWNTPMGILAGDLLFAEVFMIVNQSMLNSTMKSTISYELAKACADLCEGQSLDILFETQELVNVQEYMEMIQLKTGVLFRASARIGAIAANATPSQIDALGRFGESLGIAFQLMDDVLGLIADQKELGKPILSDIRKGKKTFILLYAYEHLSHEKARIMHQIINKKEKSEDDLNQAMKFIYESQGLEKAKILAEEFRDKAMKELDAFEESEASRDLKSIAQFVVSRTY